MTEDEAIELLSWDFINDLREEIKYVKLCLKYDLDGDEDGLLWHFTRLSSALFIIRARQVWLSDLSLSNDENEVMYALSRVPAFLREFCPRWSNVVHATKVQQIANDVVQRVKSTPHVYALCLSVEKDRTQHWDAYGGGVGNPSSGGDPYVSIGFRATSLFHPLSLSKSRPEIYAFNTANGDDHADHLIQYWAIKARKTLELLEARADMLSLDRLTVAMQRWLLQVCALAKGRGWQDEHEYRLLYITEKFGEDGSAPCKRPDGRGYVPLKWWPSRLPISQIVPHPLADVAMVKRQLDMLPEGKNIEVTQSTLKPRSR
jgi:hypothetical protein